MKIIAILHSVERRGNHDAETEEVFEVPIEETVQHLTKRLFTDPSAVRDSPKPYQEKIILKIMKE